MTRKIIISLLFILISTYMILNVNAGCSTIDGCLEGSLLVDGSGDQAIDLGFKDKVLDWVTKIAGFLGLMAVLAIVFGSFMMVISTGEEEKIKKAKDMIKWAILGFLGIVLAASLIAIVVNFMYSL